MQNSFDRIAWTIIGQRNQDVLNVENVVNLIYGYAQPESKPRPDGVRYNVIVYFFANLYKLSNDYHFILEFK